MKREELVVGRCYYIVMFEDEGLTEPIIQTLRYMQSVEVGGELRRRFEELGANEDDQRVDIDESDVDHLVLDGDGLLERLRRAFDGSLGKIVC